jgi:hypothetical protein
VLTATARTTRVWDAATGEPITPPLRCAQRLRQVEFLADDRVRWTCRDGTAGSLELKPDDRPVDELLLLTRVLAGSRVDADRGLVPLEPERLRQAWQRLKGEE